MFNRKMPLYREVEAMPVGGSHPHAATHSNPIEAAQTTIPPALEPECGHVVVGRGSRIHGTVGECRVLDVYGVLEADVATDFLILREGGGIRGMVQAVNARVLGTFEGTLMVNKHLEIANTGLVTGDVSYQTLAISSGAKLRGNVVCSEPAETEPAMIEVESNVVRLDAHPQANAT